MKTTLGQISATIQDIAEAIKDAFSIDVEIADDSIVRVAATATARLTVGNKMKYGSATQRAIRYNTPIIIESAMQHPVCQTCPGFNLCDYSGGIIVPVIYHREAIGTINVVAYEKEQLNQLMLNRNGIINFLYKMSELLCTKIQEKKTLQKERETNSFLHSIFNTIDHGIVALDRQGNMMQMNNVAKEMLAMRNETEWQGHSLQSLFQEISYQDVLNGETIRNVNTLIKKDEDVYRFVLEMQPILEEETVLGALVIFHYYEKMRDQAYQFTNVEQPITFKDIISRDDRMTNLKARAQRFAQSNSTIMITGQSGTGKELFARSIHSSSNRLNQPFISVNCGALPESLIESELFGYEKGAFTGAHGAGKPGKFELADKGTLFLDEISTMPLYMQTKLLRVLQTREVDKIGGKLPIKVDIRIIATSNENLKELVDEGKFRDDLYYRLNVIPVDIPSLQERPDDITLLSNYFLTKYNHILGRSLKCFDSEAEELLLRYHWQGNIRELENVIEYAVNFSDPNELIATKAALPTYIKQDPSNFQTNSTHEPSPTTKDQNMSVETFMKKRIDELLRQYGTSTKAKEKVAVILGISKATLYRRIKKYELQQ